MTGTMKNKLLKLRPKLFTVYIFEFFESLSVQTTHSLYTRKSILQYRHYILYSQKRSNELSGCLLYIPKSILEFNIAA